MNFSGRCLGTGIGSLPFTDVQKACAIVREHLPEIPFWPQLPKLGFREQMVPQYSEAFPGIVIDLEREKISVDSNRALAELERFYEKEMAGEADHFRLSPDYAAGLTPFIEGLREERPSELICTKGHVTGPVTFGFSVKDEEGRAIFYDPNLQDAVVRLIAMKALYQIERLREFHVPTIIFMDEPYMAAFGTTGMNVGREEVVQSLNGVVKRIGDAGGIAGVHCCGNTDWSLLFETDVDIVNFDAYDFMDRMALYPEAVKAFLNRGGNLAWGIVPTSAAVREETAESLAGRFRNGYDKLVSLGVDARRLRTQCLVTPACGLGSLSEADALRALGLVRDLSLHLRSEFGSAG
ncbi:MAG: methionine synthase [Deltaproteobacteria bacterium]|nr:methionine synthase [Deltaproteobacteria bacterium]